MFKIYLKIFRNFDITGMKEHVFIRIYVKVILSFHSFTFTENILNLHDNTYIYHLIITYFAIYISIWQYEIITNLIYINVFKKWKKK